MASCRVAILLVSQDYLASSFIQVEEFSSIITAAANGGLTVFWIAVGTSTYQETVLASLQAANNPGRPLKELSPADREKAWLDMVKKIDRLVS
jgi:internalin A